MAGDVTMRQSSRRAFLSAATGCGLALSGCSTLSQSTSPPTDSAAPITALDVTSEAIAVELGPDADVSELSLIGPDGEAVTSKTVTAGETRVTVPILDVSPGTAEYEHYTPGDHELVAIVNGEEFSQSLSLEPDIELVAVEQYRDGSSVQDYGRIMISLENHGSGPTWAYDITFDRAPNYSANTELTENIGLPYTETLSDEISVLIPPNDTRRYISQFAPLILPEGEYDCDREVANFSMSVGIATGTVIDTSLSASLDGAKETADISGGVVCDQVTVAQQEGK